jgi:hypothetical protein
MGSRYFDAADLPIPMPSGEQLVIRSLWEQFEGSRDALSGIVQHSAHLMARSA